MRRRSSLPSGRFATRILVIAGVSAARAAEAVAGKLFDLQGRQVQQPAPARVYKIMVKSSRISNLRRGQAGRGSCSGKRPCGPSEGRSLNIIMKEFMHIGAPSDS